jgi:glutaredoxin
MLQIWHIIKGYVAGVVAFIACPCHLPITLPILLALTAGTAFGTWLENNTFTVGVISTIIFIGGVVLAFKWVGASKPPLPDRYAGLPKVTLLTSSACAPCEQAKAIWRQVHEQVDFKFEDVDITSPRGRDLAARHNIFTTPAAIVNERVVLRGTPDLEKALAVVHPHPHAAVTEPV